jgi:hypothetical protein
MKKKKKIKPINDHVSNIGPWIYPIAFWYYNGNPLNIINRTNMSIINKFKTPFALVQISSIVAVLNLFTVAFFVTNSARVSRNHYFYRRVTPQPHAYPPLSLRL